MPNSYQGDCEGVDQPIEVSFDIIDVLGISSAEETVIRHTSDQYPNCPLLESEECSPEVRWVPQGATRIIAVISQRLKR